MTSHSEDRRNRIAEGLRRYYEANPKRKDILAQQFTATQNRHPAKFAEGRLVGQAASAPLLHRPPPESILGLSSRTVRKILKRLGVGCSRCGWAEGTSDLHHIRGRKVPNPDHHENLALLCPNCHRLVHEKKVEAHSLTNFYQQVGDSWRNYYYYHISTGH